MAIRDLPDMYTLIPRACGPRASGIHIRQIPHGHVTTIKCTLGKGNKPGIHGLCIPVDSFDLGCESVTYVVIVSISM